MRAVFWKELVELWLGLMVGLALATVFGLMMGHNTHREMVMPLIVMLGIEGCLLGARLAVLDRRAASDEFLLHRPVSAARIHIARGAAGLAVLALVVGATFAVMSYAAYRQGFDLQDNPLPNWDLEPWWKDVTPGRVAFGTLFAAVAWAITRLGGSAARPLTAMFLAPALPYALVLLIGRTSGVAAPTAIVTAVGVVALGLGVANEAQRRSTGRS